MKLYPLAWTFTPNDSFFQKSKNVNNNINDVLKWCSIFWPTYETLNGLWLTLQDSSRGGDDERKQPTTIHPSPANQKARKVSKRTTTRGLVVAVAGGTRAYENFSGPNKIDNSGVN